jgi:hypothetical protein
MRGQMIRVHKVDYYVFRLQVAPLFKHLIFKRQGVSTMGLMKASDILNIELQLPFDLV